MEESFVSEKIPFFSPLSQEETCELSRLFCEVHINKGEKVGQHKGDALYFVKEGFFQSEGVLQRSETVYLQKGSVIGSLPFTKERTRGDVRAVSPSVLYSADVNALHRFFMSHFPALRGYLKVVDKSGIPVSQSASDILGRTSTIITICGNRKSAGRTIASLFIAKKLSNIGNAVICDMSTTGMSIFDYCMKKLSPPLAQKKEGERNENYFSERIIKIEKGISLLNVNFGSNVSADSSLVSPLLCYLSTIYDYIILDVDGSDISLEAEAISASDYVVPVCGNEKEIRRANSKFSGLMNEGQILINAVRGFHEHADESTTARIFIPEIKFSEDNSVKDVVFRAAEDDSYSTELLSRKREYITFSTGGLGALYYAGLLPLISESLKNGNTIKCHSFAYPLIALYLDATESEYLSKVRKLFREEKIETLIQYTYPGDSLIKNEPLLRWASEITGMTRMEDTISRIFTSLQDETGKMKIMSEGLLREIIASSMCSVPPCSFVKTSVGLRGACSPVTDSYMFRHPFGKSISYSIKGGDDIANKRIKTAVRFGFLQSVESSGEKWMYDRNIVIDVNDIRFNIKGLIKESGKLWSAAISESKTK